LICLALLEKRGFGRDARLLTRKQFDLVFKRGRARSGPHLTLVTLTNTHSRPRLGLTVSKKVARRAVQRNYMKRVLREVFRNGAKALPGVDIVALVRKAFARAQAVDVRREFDELMGGRDP
jgi:ribonuclease P protein component